MFPTLPPFLPTANPFMPPAAPFCPTSRPFFPALTPFYPATAPLNLYVSQTWRGLQRSGICLVLDGSIWIRIGSILDLIYWIYQMYMWITKSSKCIQFLTVIGCSALSKRMIPCLYYD